VAHGFQGSALNTTRDFIDRIYKISIKILLPFKISQFSLTCRRGVSPPEGMGTAAETHARAEAKKAAALSYRANVQSVGGLVVPPAVSYRARRSGHMAKTLFIITCFSLSAWMA
jgi:hypothetical protein